VGVHDIALSKKKQWQECATNNALEMEGESGRGEVVDEEENCWGRASAGMEGPQPPCPWP